MLLRVLAAAAFLFLARQFVGDFVLDDALEFLRSARDGLVYLFGTTRVDSQRRESSSWHLVTVALVTLPSTQDLT